MKLEAKNINKFQKWIHFYYEIHGRKLPWRETEDPYKILVSEVMLQQTGVERVIPKFTEWISVWPTVEDLAGAEIGEVLARWSGLGYNRRALALHRTAQKIRLDFQGKIPDRFEELITLPGIGTYTAAALIAFAFNKPIVMIETNIRTVFLYHFFPGEENVTDADLMPLVESTLDKDKPRQWYNALMDYGTEIKALIGNSAKASSHYTKQKSFKGSHRQKRGLVLKELIREKHVNIHELLSNTGLLQQDIEMIIDQFQREGFVDIFNDTIEFKKDMGE